MKYLICFLIFSLIFSSPPNNFWVCRGIIMTINEFKGGNSLELKVDYIEKECSPESLKYAMLIDELICELVQKEGIYNVIETFSNLNSHAKLDNFCKNILGLLF